MNESKCPVPREQQPTNEFIELSKSIIFSSPKTKTPMNDTKTRNLGFYNSIQTDLANYFKSLVIDWLNDDNTFLI